MTKITRATAQVGLLPAAIVLALWLALTPAAGGFHGRDWYLAGLVACAVLVTVVLAGGGSPLPPGRWPRALLGAFGGLVVLSLLSAAWAPSAGGAWEAGNLLLTYLAGAWVLALAPWRPAPALLLVAAWPAGVAIICGVELVSALSAADIGGYFTENRYSAPIGYANGLAGIAVIAAVPALAVAAHRGLPAPVQGLMVAIAALLVEVALLPQSRGAVLALVLGLLAVLALVPHRWALVARALVVAAATLAASAPLLDVYETARASGRVSDALDDAARAMLLTVVPAGLAGTLIALLERRVTLGERGRRGARRAGFALAAAVVVVLASFGVAHSERIADEARAQWRQLADPGPDALTAEYRRRKRLGRDDTTTRLLIASPSQRYDYLRVALRSFRAHPVAGDGAYGFESRYTRERRFDKYSRFTHNLTMRVAGDHGVLGLLLLIAVIAAAAVGLWRGARGAGAAEKAVAAAALGVGVSFLVHAQVDWIEVFPAIGAPVLGLVVVALVVLARDRSPAPAPAAALPRARGAAVVVVTVLAALSLAFPYLAGRYRERATAGWRSDAAAAYRDLDRAAALDPLSAAAHLAKGLIALERREPARAQRAFERALEREDAWLTRFELGLAAAALGDEQAAMRQLQQAQVLNPLEEVISAARVAISRGERVDPGEYNGRLFEGPLFNPRTLT